MKLLQFKRHNETRLGVKTNRGILDVKEASNYFQIYTPTNMHALILAEEEGMQALRSLVEVASTNYALFYNENEMDFAPVIHNPDKIICVGLNYVPHVEESKMKIPESPVLFSKFNNTLAAHKEEISLPNIAEKYDYEAELVIVIGKKAYQINEEEALSYVFGYTVGNDLSARDLQFNSSQWLLGKTLNQFGPVGPYVVTADEIDPGNLSIECKVNGEVRQASNTKNMIFSCASLISYISQHVILKPGDIIYTGTPEGVIIGYPEKEQVWLQSGDEVEVTIENIGTLKNVLV